MSQRQRPAIVYLDEIDVLQMMNAALEMAWDLNNQKETYGLLLGVKTRSRYRLRYRIHFGQILQKGRRTSDGVWYGNEAFKILRTHYHLDAVGDYHSHNDNPLSPTKIYSENPSHSDLGSALSDYGPGALIAVIHTKQVLTPSVRACLMVRMKTKIRCFVGRFTIDFNFFTFKNGVQKIARNKKATSYICRAYPVCFLRKKIHLDPKSNMQVI